MSQQAAFRFGREAPSRIAGTAVMFGEANELLPEEPMYQPIPFYPSIVSGSGAQLGAAPEHQSWASYPTRCDLSFYQGDDVTIPLTIADPSDITPDMSTAWEWSAQIRVLHSYRSTLVNTFSIIDAYTPPAGEDAGVHRGDAVPSPLRERLRRHVSLGLVRQVAARCRHLPSAP